ncbi:MAG: hypothetical protein AAF533_24205 [Acidobacteriota bacterium]
MTMTRRRLLQGGLAAGGVLATRRLGWASGAAGAATPDLSRLAQAITVASREDAFDVGARALARGATPEQLLGAVFLAGVREVRPRHVGGKLHCVMMVESACQLNETATPQQARLAALWNLDDFKSSQARDRREGDWSLPPRPDVTFASETVARRELHAAMQAWDDDRADRAIVGLLPFHDRASLFEILWPYCARSIVSLGHKIILGAHVERTLARIGWQHAEPALRNLVHGLLHVDGGGRADATWEPARELAAALPTRKSQGRASVEESARWLPTLRTATSREVQELVAAGLADGLAESTAWDSLRLFAAEVCWRRPILLPVHALTEVNAFAHAASRTASLTRRRELLLQVAGWMPLIRDALVERSRLRLTGPGIETLGEAIDPAAPEPAGDVDTLRRDPARLRRWLERDDTSAGRLAAELRDQLTRKARQSHQFKLAAALWEESRRIAPRWRSRLLAGSLGYLPESTENETETLRRSVAALRRHGMS